MKKSNLKAHFSFERLNDDKWVESNLVISIEEERDYKSSMEYLEENISAGLIRNLNLKIKKII